MRVVYKILTPDQWEAFVRDGRFAGSPDDARDGFIHLSNAEQVAGTVAKHFRKPAELRLVALRCERFGENLRDEISRGGQAFPHLYDALAIEDVLWVRRIARDEAGEAVLPALRDAT